jgi:hypothetical protein
MQQAIYSNFPLSRVIRWEWQRFIRTDVLVLTLVLAAILSLLFYAGSVEALQQDGKAAAAVIGAALPTISRLFIVFFMVLSLGADYGQGTFRKRLLSGYARVDLIMTKLVLLAFAMILFWVVMLFLLPVFQLLRGVDMLYFLNQNLVANILFGQVLFGAFAMMLVSITQKTGLSFVFYFVWGFIEDIAKIMMMLVLKKPDLAIYFPLTGAYNVLERAVEVGEWFLLVPMAWLLIFLMVTWLKVISTEF